ncbi:MAG TPA: Crp/Fnr family transcriptional regulator [Ramlibacter sp.]|nr:Crp/Fnr family transcriptional regulator [Ramlibacter sp.]
MPPWPHRVPDSPTMLHDISRPATQFLQRQRWFAGLAAAEQHRIGASVSTLRGAKGDVLLRANEAVEGCYAVLSGLVKLQSPAARGRRHAYLGIPAGEWFGEGSVMKDEPRHYDVIALRDCELLCLPRSEFAALRATSLAFNQTLTEQFNMRLGQAMIIIETMRLRTPEQRVAMYLGRHLWHGPRRLSLSQEELGNLAGLSRQTVNHALQRLEQQGLVSLDFGRVSILDEEGLMALAMRSESSAPGDPAQAGASAGRK